MAPRGENVVASQASEGPKAEIKKPILRAKSSYLLMLTLKPFQVEMASSCASRSLSQ